MYSFCSDYSEGAHPSILAALEASNLEQNPGYSCDSHTTNAVRLIKQQIGREDAAIHIIPGGTLTNLTCLGAFLRPHEAVIAAASAHVSTHEAGAIEATGHKVYSIDTPQGKLTVQQIEQAIRYHADEHMVKPKLVYLSQSTEVGTLYSRAELSAISWLCRNHHMYLYLDGARLGSALTSPDNDLTLKQITDLVDCFYIGGTKNGALMGEAVVIVNTQLQQDFRYHIKQRGAMQAKGWLLGIQFERLFTDDLFFELARHANTCAQNLVEGIQGCGYEFLYPTVTNQIFPILPDSVATALEENYDFIVWDKSENDHSVLRLVTSWATPQEAVDGFLSDLRSLSK